MSTVRTLRASEGAARVRELGVIPVVQLHSAEEAEPLFDALSGAGLPALEITLRSEVALDALSRLLRLRPDGFIGAGTVLRVDDAARALDAGAKFIVSPATNLELIEFCQSADVLVMPGAFTPTEVDRATRAGAPLVKLFPAEAAGGLKFLRALAAPFREVSFVPTGGINEANLAEYLRVPQVAACGGSWIVPRKALYDRDFAAVEARARTAREIVAGVRANG